MNTPIPAERAFHHALKFRDDLCIGCSHCMNVCPTEAIRVQKGKARMIGNRCIDCGDCFRVCPVGAIMVEQDDFNSIYRYQYRVALIPAIFTGQFPDSAGTRNILSAVMELGFTHVMEVEQGVEYLIERIEDCLDSCEQPGPLISSFCPAVVRLIQVKFPTLVSHIIRLKAPVDITATHIRKQLLDEGALPEEIGIYYVAPCPAKIVALKEPVGESVSTVTGVINMNYLFNKVYKILRQNKQITRDIRFSPLSARAVCWSLTRGEAGSINEARTLAIDEINNVVEFLEKLENEEIDGIDFLELRACDESCAGGILCPGNRFITAEKVRNRARKCSEIIDRDADAPFHSLIPPQDPYILGHSGVEDILPRSILKLDDDLSAAMTKMKRIYELNRILPQVDCGICGAPTCKSFAEDVVQVESDIRGCIFIQRVHEQNEWMESAESVAIMKRIWGEGKLDKNSLKDSNNDLTHDHDHGT